MTDSEEVDGVSLSHISELADKTIKFIVKNYTIPDQKIDPDTIVDVLTACLVKMMIFIPYENRNDFIDMITVNIAINKELGREHEVEQ